METRFKNWQAPKIKEGKLTKWHWLVRHKEGLKLGQWTDIGAFSLLMAKYGIVIEDYVQIGGGTKIYSEDTISHKKGMVVLKKNCKVGANSVVLPGVTIGENSVIAACSVVRYGTIVPANEIWAGSPAKKIGCIRNEKRYYQK